MNDKSREKCFVPVVNCVVRSMGRCDEELRVENATVAVSDVLNLHWIHVMNDGTTRYVVAVDAEVASVVSCNHVVANLLPLARGVELLVDPSVETESAITNNTS